MTNKTSIIAAIEKEQMSKEIPNFSPGDTVVVQVKVKEGSRERLQAFEGVVLAKRNRQLNSAFTVREISIVTICDTEHILVAINLFP